MSALSIYAGADALQHIQKNGLTKDDVGMMLGASGGPKWLVLASLDRYLMGKWFADRKEPLHLLGTSAGAWRLSCYAQNDPIAALARLEEAYLSQQYPDKATRAEISQVIESILDHTLGETGGQEIVNNPIMRYHNIVTRCKGLGAFENGVLQATSMLGAFIGNLATPGAMRPFVERVLFHHPELPPVVSFPDFPARKVVLTEKNIKQAILASGSIPIIFSGVKNIPGAPMGMYRDGGITDYQFNLPVMPKNGIVLYPHYSATPPKAVWFDKKLKRRVATKEHYKRTVIIAPSHEFVATLPGGKIPDRQDVFDFPEYSVRRKRWDTVMKECERLADEFAEIDQKQSWAEVAQPLPW